MFIPHMEGFINFRCKYRKMKSVLLILLILASSHLFGQTLRLPCGTDAWEVSIAKEDSTYTTKRSLVETLVDKNRNGSASRLMRNECQQLNGDTILPIVVHVVYFDAVSNISDQAIKNMIDTLNYEWTGKKGGENMGFRFALAKRDTNGNATNGIYHVDGSSIPNYATQGAQSVANDPINLGIMNVAPAWNKDNYINIWIVQSNAFSGAGAYLYRTIMIRNVNVPTSGNLVHEMGHFFNLFHTFQGSTTTQCPIDTNPYFDGDKCADTHPHKTADCGTTSCTGSGNVLDVFKNYMSYCARTTMFTRDQKDRVMASLSRDERWCLALSDGLIPSDIETEVSLDSIQFVNDLSRPLCDSLGTIQMKVSNLGTKQIDSLKSWLYINDSLIKTTTSIESITPHRSKWITLHTTKFDFSGSYNIKLILKKINNDSLDYRTINNSLCSDFNIAVKGILVNGVSNPLNAGTITGTQIVSCDKRVTLTATANNGFIFDHWEDVNGNVITTNNVYDIDIDIANAIDQTYISKFTILTDISQNSIDKEVRIYPNPATDKITINLNNQTEFKKLTIINSIGGIIQEIDVINLKDVTIDLKNYERGNYFLNVIKEQAVYNFKLIIL